MPLFILRHGEAHSFAATDAERALTELGREQVEQTLLASLSDMADVDCIYASPYVRAQQTAEIASRLLRLPIITCDQLVPDSPRSDLVRLIESLQHDLLDDGVKVTPLLVSHQPLVGGFVDWLCGLEYGRHVMGTSALAGLDVDVIAGGCGSLNFMRQP